MISYKRNQGISLIEILVALLVTLIGILGFIGLQARSQQSDLESFQREQALRIVDFMVNQINTNRPAAGCYDLNTITVGTGYTGTYTCSAYGTSESQTQVAADIAQWDLMLKGANETLGSTNVGSMIGARGCITFDGTDTFTVSVAWQGLIPGAVPVNTCGIVGGANPYGDDNLRRVMSVTIEFAGLGI